MKLISTTRIAFASFIGTAIEFYDFYIYGLAEALATSIKIDANLWKA